MSKSIAIIPARGGSKRIPRKNIKNFLGRPIISYSIEAALNSGLFSEVMVSTDDEEIKEVSLKYGASVPFMRSEKNSNDFATTADVLIETLSEYAKKSIEFDYLCCIYPTAPFVTPEKLISAFSLLEEKKADTVFPAVKFSYPIFRSLKIDEQGKVAMFWPENLNARSQDLPAAYHDAGQFYWAKADAFLENKKMFTDNSFPIIMDEREVQDIDNEEDWNLAEVKYKLLLQKNSII